MSRIEPNQAQAIYSFGDPECRAGVSAIASPR